MFSFSISVAKRGWLMQSALYHRMATRRTRGAKASLRAPPMSTIRVRRNIRYNCRCIAWRSPASASSSTSLQPSIFTRLLLYFCMMWNEKSDNKSCSVTVVAEQSCCHAIRDVPVASCDTAISIQVWRYQIRRAPFDAAVDLDRRWRCAGGAASRAISRRRQA